MKKLLYVCAGIIMVSLMVSCEKQNTSPQGEVGIDALKGQAAPVIGPSSPAITVGQVTVTPYIIPGENRGGNRTCEEAQAFFNENTGDGEYFDGMVLGEFTDCGDKVDIDDDYVGEVDGFPFHVEVNEDGSVYFNTGDRECLVKIVIVKGSNKANVYYFPDGITEADGLSAPAFNGGRFPWVSNLTFCCFCEEQEGDDVIAIKVIHNDGHSVSVAGPSGSNPWSGDGWCEALGVNPYPDYTPIDLEGEGSAVVAEGSVTVTMNNAELEIDDVYIYVGPEPEASSGCPDYTDWMHFSGDGDNSLVCTW